MTTIEWLKEYTDTLAKSSRINVDKVNKARKTGKKTKSIIVLARLGIMLFAFFTSAYVSTKNGVLRVPNSVRGAVIMFPKANIGKLFTSTIDLDLASIIQNIEQSRSDSKIIEVVKAIIKGAKEIDKSSNEFFGGIFDSIFGFLDKIICPVGNFVININYSVFNSIIDAPQKISSLAEDLIIGFSDMVSKFSINSLLPFPYNPEPSNQSIISIRDLYRKLKQTRELIEGKTIVITERTQQINENITKQITVIQEGTAITQDQAFEDRLTALKNEIFSQIASDVTNFQTKIGSQIITQNNYYYSEAAKTARFDGIFNQEITFNENVVMNKNLSVNSLVVGATTSIGGPLSLGSYLDFGAISTPSEQTGRLYRDEGDDSLWYFNGSDWIDLVTGGTGVGSITVEGINGTPITVPGVQTIQFDQDTGFEVTDQGSNTALISIGSHWKDLYINGIDVGMTPSGQETLNFVAGNNIGISADPNSVPKSLTFKTLDDLIISSLKASTSSGLPIYDTNSNLGIFIQDGGNVGVGTASPDAKLDVVGQIIASSSFMSGNVLASGSLTVDNTASISGSIQLGSLKSCNTIDTDADGNLVCGTDEGAGVGMLTHGLLSDEWHNDVGNASASRGSLIYGDSSNKWNELTIGADNTVLVSDGTDISWRSTASWDTNTTYSVLGDPLSMVGTVIDIDYASGSAGGYILGSDFETLWGHQASINAHIDWTAASQNFSTTGSISGTRASISDSLTVGDIMHAGILTDGTATLTAGVLSGLSSVTSLTGSFTHVSVSDDFEALSAQLTSASIGTLNATTLNLPDNSIAEADINFATACAAGNHLYVNGNDLACEADDNTTYTFNNPLSLVGTAVSIDYASADGGGYLTNADWTTFNNKQTALTFQLPLVNVGNTISASFASAGSDGWLSGTDWSTFNNKQATITAADPLWFSGTTLDIDYASGSAGGYILGSDFETLWGHQASINAHIDWTAASQNFSTTGSISGTRASISDSLTVGDIMHAGILTDGTATLTAGVLSGLSSVTSLTGSFTHVSVSDDFEALSAQLTSASIGTLNATTLNLPDNSIAEADINFATACAAGNHLYVNGNDLACEADDNTTYTFNNPLSLVGTAVSIDYASADGGGYLTNADWTTFNNKQTALTFQLPLVNVGNTISASFASAGSDGWLSSIDWTTFNSKQTALTFAGPLNLSGTTLNIDLASASGGGYLSSDNYSDIWGHMASVNQHIDWTAASSSFFTTGNLAVDGTASISGAVTLNNLANCNTIDTDADGNLVCGTDEGAGVGMLTHGLLSDEWHNDVGNASASRGSLIYGDSSNKWNELTIGADNTVLVSDGTDISWRSTASWDTNTTYSVLGDPLSMVGTVIDIDYASGSAGGYILGSDFETLWGHQASINAHIDWTAASQNFS
ncbi:MAG: hypothetical protein PHT07_24685, partial [Paludibacter sp.]|nr:hypothetical protein [Paludibacter sp.]